MNPHGSTEFGIAGSWLAEYTLRAVGAGVLVFDADARIVQWCGRAATAMGCREEELAGRRLVDDRWSPCRPDGTALDEDPIGRVLRTGVTVEDAELGLRRPDGARTWCAVTALPVFGPDRAPRAVLAAIRDVSDRVDVARLSRARLAPVRESFEHSVAAKFVVADDGMLLDWNGRALEVTGRTDLELAVARFDEICDIDLEWLAEETRDGRVVGRTWVVRAAGREVETFARFDRVPWPHVGHALLAQVLEAACYPATLAATTRRERGRDAA